MNKTLILGLDIGGANTKAALIEYKNQKISFSISYIEYFPFWEKTIDNISSLYERVIDTLITKSNNNLENVDVIAVAITAELSDVFKTKKEGILTILDSLVQAFEEKKLNFISTKGNYIDFKTAKDNFSSISAANWVSTSLFLGKFIPKCILIDAGSTTIDLIPILNSIPITKGLDDISRLQNHELVYTGGLRATIPSISHFVPYKSEMVRISFEKFALISDVHLVLGNISEDEYTNDTADNRSKSLEDCYARLARIICMDLDTISKDELSSIARYIFEKQLYMIVEEIKIFMKTLTMEQPGFHSNPMFVITGISSEFLTKRALNLLGYQNIKNYEEVTKISDRSCSSAIAVAGAYFYMINDEG